ncbi:cytochrome c oxidase assembly protein [Marivita sp. S0852]|uniref:cytochrome c oxidase assembly protein n=1 Tax=Marivita sp. S0852 TaxID=3373893 RepID=UPI003982D153
MDDYTPFCGTPPLPTELLTRWTFDPLLIVGLLLAWGVGIRFAANTSRFSGAWALVAILFVSPLCAASMALFSARVAQHILLTLVAAPLLASALPKLRLPPMLLALVFAALFWFWHVPIPYQATLESDLTYWAMHLSLFGAATLLFGAFRATPEKSVMAAAFTGAQLTLFAVTLTLAPTPWHDWHLLTTIPYGITPLGDQQFAGALMWVAGGLLFLAVLGKLAFQFLRDTATEPAR